MSEEPPQDESPKGRSRLRTGCMAVLALAALVLLVFAGAWLNREAIADNVIADALAKQGITARYEIASIGPDKQILHNIEVGDEAAPDLTVEWAIVTIKPRFGFPYIENVRLVRPRLYGTYRKGVLSFGALDPLLFAESETDFALPDLNVTLESGGALLETDYGRFGASLSGQGNLINGFAGEVAVASRGVAAAGCAADGATLYGTVAIKDRRPEFSGPLRLAEAACASQAAGRKGLSLKDAVATISVRGSADLLQWEGTSDLSLAGARFADAQAGATQGNLRFTWRDQALNARYDLTALALSSDQARVAKLNLEGHFRSLRSFERMEVTGSISGENATPGAPVVAMVEEAKRAGAGSAIAPVVTKMGTALLREAKGSRFSADYTVRLEDGMTSVVVPAASLRGGSGGSLLALSRIHLLFEDGTMTEIAGNFATGGKDLPRFEGRMEQRGNAPATLNMAMAPYAAGSTLLAVPQLQMRQGAGGTLQFAGEVRASGDLPEGRVDGLVLPVNGRWASASGLVIGTECTDVRFEALRLASVAFGRQQIRLCPLRGSPLLRYASGSLRMAAQLPALDLRGRVGDSPLAVRTGTVAFAYPGLLAARDVAVTLGEADAPNRFSVASLTADLGRTITGSFSGTDAALAAVPLNLRAGHGQWRFADGRLDLSQAAFRVEDRAATPRFEPLVARDAVLSLFDNAITSTALLREPTSDTPVVRVGIAHNLNATTGSADLAVEGLTFSRALQPAQLTDMARGMIANARGTVTGRGRIDWTPDRVTSSGRFATEGLDLAAPFGPVRGLTGTIHFTDLLNLTTAPNQQMRIASIDPGIEIFDGVVRYSLTDATLLQLSSGVWPLMGGTLTMEPMTIRFGESEIRRYSFKIEGLDAARVVSHMELNNIGARGLFDGTIPVVFDASGNGRLEGGMLISRAPGGTVSYVGELTYEDLSPMANYAFSMLRSLNYQEMSVQMDGPLAGEIVTKVRFDGVSQGEGTKQNFITRKLAKLPIRFVMNIRAPFYSLMGSMRALYDPSAIRDPREIGLIDKQGAVLRRQSDGLPQMPLSSNEPPVSKDAQ